MAISVIPDIHADPERLSANLKAAGSGQLAFLGDFIDSGHKTQRPDDRAVLSRIRGLIEDNGARAVMGNHELNAILFHTLGADGKPLRQRDDKNRDQHASFIAQFGEGTTEAKFWTDWFLGLPLWLDLEGLRIVHACWDKDAIATIAGRRKDGRILYEDLPEIAEKKSPFARAVERLTSGPEIELPKGWSFLDSKNVRRSHVRIAWWRAGSGSWQDAALSVPDPSELPASPIGEVRGVPSYGEDEPPALVGHYKMMQAPRIEAAQAACLDYPNSPCLYHWDGEPQLLGEGLRVVID